MFHLVASRHAAPHFACCLLLSTKTAMPARLLAQADVESCVALRNIAWAN